MPKTKKCLEDIDCFIRENHPKECGIIYCLSRMDCEKVAEKLRVTSSDFKLFTVQACRVLLRYLILFAGANPSLPIFSVFSCVFQLLLNIDVQFYFGSIFLFILIPECLSLQRHLYHYGI